MAKPADIDLAVIGLGIKTVGVLRLITDDREEISFCFSQIDIFHCLKEFRRNGVYLGPDEVKEFKRKVEESNMPDFDTEEKITFDDFTSHSLSVMMEECAVLMHDPMFVNTQYQFYRSSGFKFYWLPQIHRVEEINTPPLPSGFYYNTKPMEAGILHCKTNITCLLGKFRDKQIKKRIRRSALPDDTWDPIEWLPEAAAEIFGFIHWLYIVSAKAGLT
jgi:hypothetical protein